ncbi:MAG: vWA domain-containing protein, partial [Planctomycetota bacterium]
MDVRFFQLEALHWLWGVAAIVVVLVIGAQLRRRALRRFASEMLHRVLVPHARPGRALARSALVVAALVMLVAGMIDPRWGVTYEEVEQRGIDVMVVLDVSRSMLAEDARPNRLERARQYIGDLVEQLAGDRVGLITFAGVPAVRCPLTADYGAFRLILDTVHPESAQRGGSLLGDALRLAGESFTDDLPEHKVILVFSDGEDHGSYPLEAAQALSNERQIPVYTFGIGDTEQGGRIPIVTAGRRSYLMHEGQQVWSRMNPGVLRDVALACGGAYVPVGTGSVDMARIFTERIEPVSERSFETTMRERHHPRYQWFV